MTCTSSLPRTAVIDLLFCWPPKGGADVDVFHVLSGLTNAGATVKLFVPVFAGAQDRGLFDPNALPFLSQAIPMSRLIRGWEDIVRSLQNAVNEWKPEVVLLTHGYALKPYVALALCDTYPVISRYYAHEAFCARDAYRFIDGAPCPKNYLSTPDFCRSCALQSLKGELCAGYRHAWAQDYLLAQAYHSSYWHIYHDYLQKVRKIIVYNTDLQYTFGEFMSKTVVIPGGVSPIKHIPSPSLPATLPTDKKIILMCGRVEDPAKGLSVLLEAGKQLWQERNDFHILLSHFDIMFRGSFYTSTGWLSYLDALSLYSLAYVCAVPSLWEEPFGLVAVEAMQQGVPVCASNTGGLKEIIIHGHTGFLIPPGNVNEWVYYLTTILDDVDLRLAMGNHSAKRVAETYYWERIVSDYYIPLLEFLK